MFVCLEWTSFQKGRDVQDNKTEVTKAVYYVKFSKHSSIASCPLELVRSSHFPYKQDTEIFDACL